MSDYQTFSTGNDMGKDIYPEQIRAARGLLGWTQEDLANASGLTVRTLARIESAQTTPRQRTLEALSAALEAAGVEFIRENGGGPGVRLTHKLSRS